MNKTISVIIPVYNREMLVKECIGSVLAQSYTNFEIILVDDGSTDNTLNICKKLAKTDHRIKLLESNHLGVSGARNLALDNANGEFVFFLDSDDVIHPMLFETLVRGINEHNSAMAATNIVNVSEKSWHKVYPKMQETKTLDQFEYYSHPEVLHKFFRSGTPINLIGGVMMLKSLIDTTRFDNEFFIGEDFYFIYQNLIKGADAVFLKPKWYYARWHDGNVSHQDNFAAFHSRFLRRVRVWQSEEQFGRYDNADIEKREAFSIYITSLTKHNLDKKSLKKVCSVIKSYENQIRPAFKTLSKIKIAVFIRFPRICRFILRKFKK